MDAVSVGGASRAPDSLAAAKAVACILVVAQHTLATKFGAFGHGWNLVNALDSLTRVAVPIFLMTSGAIFLRRTDTFTYFYTKRLVRIALPLVFWSVVYLAWEELHTGTVRNWIEAILQGPVMYHLWYFYAVIGLSLVTPVIAPWYQAADIKARWLLVATWFFFTAAVPLINTFIVPIYGSAFATGYSILDFGGYLVLGAVLTRKGLPVARLRWLGISLYLVGTAGVALATRFHSKSLGHPDELFYYNNSACVIIAATGIFLAFQHMSAPGRSTSNALMVISACSLGIYGIHPLVIAIVGSAWGKLQGHVALPALALGVLAFTISLTIIWVLRHIRPLQKVM